MTALAEFDALKASLEFYVRYLDEHIEHQREMVARIMSGDDPGGSLFASVYSDRLASAALAQLSLEEMARVADTLRVIISESENSHQIFDE